MGTQLLHDDPQVTELYRRLKDKDRELYQCEIQMAAGQGQNQNTVNQCYELWGQCHGMHRQLQTLGYMVVRRVNDLNALRSQVPWGGPLGSRRRRLNMGPHLVSWASPSRSGLGRRGFDWGDYNELSDLDFDSYSDYLDAYFEDMADSQGSPVGYDWRDRLPYGRWHGVL